MESIYTELALYGSKNECPHIWGLRWYSFPFNTKVESQAAARHFNLREHSLADLGATIIEQVKIPSEAQKGKWQFFHIRKLSTWNE